ncbi:DsbA family protein [Cohnella pontilimi]|uniref:DsbA family protein n=1 Tax=Cohnella pontilimi TaxID=2564100 RepID=A0A4U0FEY1_9BACL|nr:thioredoxin domain-containing protein [Cohnella pontilimi]TJY43407.1 DsbA family protein [Cohnella pontilimi]
MEKAKRKKEQRLKRQVEQRKKSRNMKILVWSLAAAFVILIALLVAFKPRPGAVDVAYDKLPTLGKADAPVKIVEIGDFKCPTCAYFSQQIVPELQKDYIDTGKVSLSYQNWTIIYEDSFTAALAGQAIYHQNNDDFWKFYHAILDNQQEEKKIWATPEYLTELAKQHGVKVDYDKLKQDIEKGTYKDEIDSQNRFAVQQRFTGTPTVLINGRKLDDKTSLNYNNLKAEIEKALQEAGQ